MVHARRGCSFRSATLGASLALIACLCAAAPPAAGSPPETREAKLLDALDTLAFGADGSARDAAAQRARSLLGEELDDGHDLAGFFLGYFVGLDRPVKGELHGWLSRLTLGSAPNPDREEFQAALAPALAGRLTRLFDRHLPDLGRAVARDAALREDVVNTMHLLAGLAASGRGVPPASRRAIYHDLESLVRGHSHVLRRDVTIDAAKQPLLATLRAQLYQIMRDMKPLDAESFVVATGFHGRYAEFVRKRGILVLDNNGLNDAQLAVIERLLEIVPDSLHATTRISVHSLLGTPSGPDGKWWMLIAGGPGFNISAAPIGTAAENPFPADGNPVLVSKFCAVLQHELNHAVDAHAISADPLLRERQRELIHNAGFEPLQYARSQFEEKSGPGLFVSAPQEFFASLANQYLADSLQMMELAYERFLRGYPEPLEQFLHFVDVYSEGGTTSVFYRQDENCRYEAKRVSLHRDENLLIDRIVIDDAVYDFPRERALRR